MEEVIDFKLIKEKIIKTDHVLQMYSKLKKKNEELNKKLETTTKKKKQLSNDIALINLENERKYHQYEEHKREYDKLKGENERGICELNKTIQERNKYLNDLQILQNKYQLACSELKDKQKICKNYEDEFGALNKGRRKFKMRNNPEETKECDLSTNETSSSDIDSKPAKVEQNGKKIKASIWNLTRWTDEKNEKDIKNMTSEIEKLKMVNENLKEELDKANKKLTCNDREWQEKIDTMSRDWTKTKNQLKSEITELKKTINDYKSVKTNDKLYKIETEKNKSQNIRIDIVSNPVELSLNSEQMENSKFEIIVSENFLMDHDQVSDELEITDKIDFEEVNTKVKKNDSRTNISDLLSFSMSDSSEESEEKIKPSIFDAKQDQKKEKQEELSIPKITIDENDTRAKTITIDEEPMMIKEITTENSDTTNDEIMKSEETQSILRKSLEKTIVVSEKASINKENISTLIKVPELLQKDISDTESDCLSVSEIFKEMEMACVMSPFSCFEEDPLPSSEPVENDQPSLSNKTSTILEPTPIILSKPERSDKFKKIRELKEKKLHSLLAIKKAKTKLWIRKSRSILSKEKRTKPKINDAHDIVGVLADLVSQRLKNNNVKYKRRSTEDSRNVLEVNKMLLEKARLINFGNESEKKGGKKGELLGSTSNENGRISETSSSDVEMPIFDSCYESQLSNPPSIEMIHHRDSVNLIREQKMPPKRVEQNVSDDKSIVSMSNCDGNRDKSRILEEKPVDVSSAKIEENLENSSISSHFEENGFPSVGNDTLEDILSTIENENVLPKNENIVILSCFEIKETKNSIDDPKLQTVDDKINLRSYGYKNKTIGKIDDTILPYDESEENKEEKTIFALEKESEICPEIFSINESNETFPWTAQNFNIFDENFEFDNYLDNYTKEKTHLEDLNSRIKMNIYKSNERMWYKYAQGNSFEFRISKALSNDENHIEEVPSKDEEESNDTDNEEFFSDVSKNIDDSATKSELEESFKLSDVSMETKEDSEDETTNEKKESKFFPSNSETSSSDSEDEIIATNDIKKGSRAKRSNIQVEVAKLDEESGQPKRKIEKTDDQKSTLVAKTKQIKSKGALMRKSVRIYRQRNLAANVSLFNNENEKNSEISANKKRTTQLELRKSTNVKDDVNETDKSSNNEKNYPMVHTNISCSEKRIHSISNINENSSPKVEYEETFTIPSKKKRISLVGMRKKETFSKSIDLESIESKSKDHDRQDENYGENKIDLNESIDVKTIIMINKPKETRTCGFKRPNNTKIIPACPLSPPLQFSIDESAVKTQPVIIPLEKPHPMEASKADCLFKKLITYSSEEKTVEEIAQHFRYQDASHVVELILTQILQDKEKFYTKVPHSPMMTDTQRVMFGFMIKLEEMNVDNLIEIFLRTLELRLIHSVSLEEVLSMTRMYVAICKYRKCIEKTRRMCCDAFYFMDNLAIPFFFVVLTSWIEILPSEDKSAEFPLVKLLVQLVNLKRCNYPGYNLIPLRELLNKYYGYPKEPWNSDDFFKELFDNYLKNPVRPNDFMVLLYCKNNSCKWVCEKVQSLMKPILDNIKNDNFKATVIILICNIISQFEPNLDNQKHLNPIREWIGSFTKGDNVPSIIINSVALGLRRMKKAIVKKKKKPAVKQKLPKG